jgi:hypothetical protein
MADWPDVDQLKQVLAVDDDGGSDLTTFVEGFLASAIAYVKADVGDWDEDVDEPNDNLAAAALRMGELMALRQSNAASSAAAAAIGSKDPTYSRLMYDQHRRFGIS